MARIVRACESSSVFGVEVDVELSEGVKHLRFPYSFLRDNCSSNFHNHTMQRLTAMNPEILASRAASLTVKMGVSDDIDDDLSVEWAEQVANQKEPGKFLAAVSTYSARWLLEHSLEQPCRQARLTEQLRMIEKMTAQDFYDACSFSFNDLLQNRQAMLAFMDRLWRKGLVLVTDVPGSIEDRDASLQTFARAISFLRETNYGRVFEVYSKADPNNQAFTNQVLPLHTDLPFYKMAPDIQMLHCVVNAADGGESWFVDGVAAALELKRTHPRLHKVLSTKKVQFSDVNSEYHLFDEKPIINEKRVGDEVFVTQVHFNEGVRCHVLNSCDAEEVHELYQGMIELQRIFESKQLRIEFKLQPGSMMVFNNNRVLHGRNCFDAPTMTGAESEQVSRYLAGAYIDWDDFHSKRRVLSRL